ncbi:hypothetical protein FT641_20115 [Bacillus paranthracis]|uniref:hypothetical protein n=1 Tax=Bacillus paranthracis TaxID=2026186 RepID=UPI0018798DEE|nr:hypothetical protein [Bacillus paranthracis]MBE7114632.1 hypothetical protein [Bacillus paranthracis]MBE7155001.1 hypothetical protein [Bacillus paranthracis]
MASLDKTMVTMVNLNGEPVDLGREMTASEAINELRAADCMGSVEGATPIAVDGILSFEFNNGDKGNL